MLYSASFQYVTGAVAMKSETSCTIQIGTAVFDFTKKSYHNLLSFNKYSIKAIWLHFNELAIWSANVSKEGSEQ